MNTYKLDIGKEELLGILSDYYSKMFNRKIEAKEKHNITYTGIYDDKTAEVTLYYEEEISILGHKAKKTTNISREQIENIINELIREQEIVIDRLEYNSGVGFEGFGYAEQETAYFDGITLSLRDKQKTLMLTK